MNTVRVWDLPTRVFHWALVLAFVGLVITGEVGGGAMVWHFRLGYCVLTLLLWRLCWGFAGGHWSRFSSFVVWPTTALAYLRGKGGDHASVGHNPLGSYSVLALLGFGLLQVFAGLMSDDEILATGPLTTKVPPEWVTKATFLHAEVFKTVLIVLVILHIAAIFWYRFKKNDNLVKPMLLGDKQIAAAVPSSRDDAHSRILALALLLACAAGVWSLLQWAA